MAQQNGQGGQPEHKSEMRRISQRGEVPTQKEDLIKYLTERIQQAEQALQDTEQLLNREKTKREKIAASLADREKQLNKLLQLDKKSLPEKIRDRLQEILTEAITSKLAAEKELEQAKKFNYEYKQALAELKQLEAQEAMEQEILEEKEGRVKNDIKILENSIGVAEESIRELESAIQAKTAAKDEVENKYLQMRVAVDRMGDIKNSLNRFFSHDELFDEKMDLKPQSVRKPIVREPTVQSKDAISPGMEKPPKLKPIEKKPEKNLQPSNNDDDFWSGEVSTKQLDRKPNPKQKLPSVNKK